MKNASVIQVVRNEKELRGNGRDIPYRRVVEISDFDGNLIAEKDPFSFTIEQIGEIFNNCDTIGITWRAVRDKLLGGIIF